MVLITVIVVAVLFLVIGYFVGKKIGAERKEAEWEEKVPEIREEAIKKSRAVLGGQFSEQLAPYLPDFPYSPTECRFVGKPVDFLVFKGMDAKEISEIVFVEVKSGKSTLNAQERNLRDTVQAKRVRWAEYKIPEDITKKR